MLSKWLIRIFKDNPAWKYSVLLFNYFKVFLVWCAKQKDAEQQRAFESSHAIAAVFYLMGWSQTFASGMASPDRHRVKLDCLGHSCIGSFKKNTNLSLWWGSESQLSNIAACMMPRSTVSICCSRTAELRLGISRTLSLHTCTYLCGEILPPAKGIFS